jgi:hypothetical protein
MNSKPIVNALEFFPKVFISSENNIEISDNSKKHWLQKKKSRYDIKWKNKLIYHEFTQRLKKYRQFEFEQVNIDQ